MKLSAEERKKLEKSKRGVLKEIEEERKKKAASIWKGWEERKRENYLAEHEWTPLEKRCSSFYINYYADVTRELSRFCSGIATKYGGALWGIYEITKDEPSMWKVTGALVVYGMGSLCIYSTQETIRKQNRIGTRDVILNNVGDIVAKSLKKENDLENKAD